MIRSAALPLVSRLCLLALGMTSLHATAVEGGAQITPFGVFDFGAGMLPPPSALPLVGVRTTHFHADRLYDNGGHRAATAIDLTVDSYGVALVQMTGATLFGGRYGWGMVMPWLEMKARLDVPTPAGPLALTGRHSAQGDMQLIPALVGWTPSPSLFVNAALVLQAPTGSYDRNRLVNAGTNHWTFSPTVAFSYLGATGIEVSSNIALNIHRRNSATDYTSGADYQHEFAIGQHIGAWTVGVGGYFAQQVEDDKQGGRRVDNNRSRVLAAGPAVHFFQPGSGWPLVTLHANKEFGVRNRAGGTQLALRAAWSL